MFEDIRADLQHFNRGGTAPGPLDCLRLALANFGLQALIVYRFCRWLRSISRSPLGWPLVLLLFPLAWALTEFVRTAYGVRLEQSADIGPGLYIGHFGGIVVRRCVIGEGCAIQQQVRLEPLEPRALGPTIGRSVWIGAHTQIRGDLSVGDGATIGAGALVTGDIAPRSLVLGNPGRVAQREYDNSTFL